VSGKKQLQFRQRIDSGFANVHAFSDVTARIRHLQRETRVAVPNNRIVATVAAKAQLLFPV
jgi:hypothetical protein